MSGERLEAIGDGLLAMGYWRWAIGYGLLAMGYGLWVRGERGEVMDMKNSVVEEPRCFFYCRGT